MRELGFEIARASGLPFAEGRAFFDGGKFAYVIDFGEEIAQNTSISSGSGSGPEVYDPVGLSLVLRTSYDQSWKFEAALMGRRFLCDNGLLSGEFFGRVSFRHQKGSTTDNWRETGSRRPVRRQRRSAGPDAVLLGPAQAAPRSDE